MTVRCDRDPDGCDCPTRGLVPPHGDDSTYRNHGCRCEACIEAHRQAKVGQQADRVQRLAAGDVVLPHGRVTTYTNWGCRCAECKRAIRDYQRQYREAVAR